jgi:hypothetical protein
MATAAQIDANRRNAQKSTGPRTTEGKNRSRMNALDHGCRAKVLVLPTEEFGQYEKQLHNWNLSLKPRNPAEAFLVERLVGLAYVEDRIRDAHTARLSKRMAQGLMDEADAEQETVIALTQRLFPDACFPVPVQAPPGNHRQPGRKAAGQGREAVSPVEPDSPALLVCRLRHTLTGCRWLIDQWVGLRELLESGKPWIGPDKLKAVALLECRPTDAVDCPQVAEVYMASHVLAGENGNPFQEILDELPPEHAPLYAKYLKLRGYEDRLPEDASSAKQMLLAIIDRTVEPLEQKFDELAEIAEKLAPYESSRLSWDDTPEGERLRRYETTCSRTWFRLFDLLHKVRNEGGRLDFAAVASIGQSVQVGKIAASRSAAPAVVADIAAPVETVELPTEPGEPNSQPRNAPSEPNSPVHQVSGSPDQRRKDLRIDAPHLELKPDGNGSTATERRHPALERVIGGGNASLLNLAPIFGAQ